MQTSQKDLHKKLLGRAGEKIAVNYLKKNAYKVIETNFKNKIGEIDIIAEKDNVTVFVEVKTRSSDFFGAPSEAVDKNKRRKYFLVASDYLARNKKTDSECRFDVIEIEDGKINHIENAFYA